MKGQMRRSVDLVNISSAGARCEVELCWRGVLHPIPNAACSVELHAKRRGVIIADVAFGSKADIAPVRCDVRFTPKSGHWAALL
jgi:hypothetical protein